MSNSNSFTPNWISSPGDTIADILSAKDITVGQFADSIGRSASAATELVAGKVRITLSLARKLTNVLGGTVEFWMSREFQYRKDVQRLRQVGAAWVSQFPIADMVRFGWLPSPPAPSEEVAQCLQFFGVNDTNAWDAEYGAMLEQAAFRTSPTFPSKPGSVTAWVRQGVIEASKIRCRPWNPIAFRELLPQARKLTRLKDPKEFLPALIALCAKAGVAVVVLKTPSGCHASGATRFLTDNKALLLLSVRHLSDDQFWFSFFHEAGHLLLHGNRTTILEFSQPANPVDGDREKEANQFALNQLIPKERQVDLDRLPTDPRSIISYAKDIGVSPGIVVGQLQHNKRLSFRQLNSLKRRYRWSR